MKRSSHCKVAQVGYRHFYYGFPYMFSSHPDVWSDLQPLDYGGCSPVQHALVQLFSRLRTPGLYYSPPPFHSLVRVWALFKCHLLQEALSDCTTEWVNSSPPTPLPAPAPCVLLEACSQCPFSLCDPRGPGMVIWPKHHCELWD